MRKKSSFSFFLQLLVIIFIYREGTGRSIDLRVNAVGQKEMAFQIRENGMVQPVLEKN